MAAATSRSSSGSASKRYLSKYRRLTCPDRSTKGPGEVAGVVHPACEAEDLHAPSLSDVLSPDTVALGRQGGLRAVGRRRCVGKPTSRWAFTVRSLMPSRRAICLLARPSRTSASTSPSRGVRRPDRLRRPPSRGQQLTGRPRMNGDSPLAAARTPLNRSSGSASLRSPNRADVERCDDPLAVGEGREYDDSVSGKTSKMLRVAVDPVGARHLEIDQDDVRPGLLDHPRASSPSLADPTTSMPRLLQKLLEAHGPTHGHPRVPLRSSLTQLLARPSCHVRCRGDLEPSTRFFDQVTQDRRPDVRRRLGGRVEATAVVTDLQANPSGRVVRSTTTASGARGEGVPDGFLGPSPTSAVRSGETLEGPPSSEESRCPRPRPGPTGRRVLPTDPACADRADTSRPGASEGTQGSSTPVPNSSSRAETSGWSVGPPAPSPTR